MVMTCRLLPWRRYNPFTLKPFCLTHCVVAQSVRHLYIFYITFMYHLKRAQEQCIPNPSMRWQPLLPACYHYYCYQFPVNRLKKS